jgi:outer membrane receptor protein involved in Fe transport
MKIKPFLILLISSLSLSFTLPVISADEDEEEDRDRGGIEEVTVTAEKREATVSDTSMSMSAFDSSLIEDLGLQGADDLMDQLPATTRDSYDVRIRGVGRNFRNLGGDPGVATYYNGVYSPDFGIAAGENYLFDVERIEVLRGPQGTLYGRNSIGGAINYITKKPQFENGGELRVVAGDYGTEQYYAMSTGPITNDLAFRVTTFDAKRNGYQNNVNPNGDDTNSVNDSNHVLTLLWNINDDMSFQVRANDRLSDRVIGANILLTEGYGPNRGMRNTTDAVYGVRKVDENHPNAIQFTNSRGVVGYGAPLRPGVDVSGWPGRYNPMYGYVGESVIGTFNVSANMDPNCNDWPYPNGCASNHEKFEHNGIQSNFTWDINDTTTINYIYGYVDYNYDFNYDLDNSYSEFSQYRSTVREDVHMMTHEVNINWEIDSPLGYWEVTSGAFFMDENRNQTYGLHNSVPSILEGANYSLLDTTFGTLLTYTGIDLTAYGATSSVMSLAGWVPGASPQATIANATPGFSGSGRWEGQADGAVYKHDNNVQNDAWAAYTQGTLRINEEFSLVLGVRYAEDEKTVRERRQGYSELNAFELAGFLPALNLLAGSPYVPLESDTATLAYYSSLGLGQANGVTALAATNVAIGAATYAYDPALVAYYQGLFDLGLTGTTNYAYSMFTIDTDKQINPVCAVDATDCSTPLRTYQGIPYSYNRDVSDKQKWSDTNIRVNLDWTPRDNILMYLGLTTGYRAGGYALGSTGNVRTKRTCSVFLDPTCVADSSLGVELLSYDQEEVEAIELGYKGIHLDDTLQVFWSIYSYDYDGYQDEVVQYDPVRNTSVSWASNADGITNKGFEMDLTWAATDRLTLNANYSYTETEYGEDYYVLTTDDPTQPRQVFGDFTPGYISNAATGCSQGETPIGAAGCAGTFDYSVNVKGNPLKGIPYDKYTFRVTYEADMFGEPVWITAVHSYTGDFSASGIQRALDRVPSREVTNISASWWSDDYKTSVRAYISNLFDNDRIRGIGTSDDESNFRVTGSPLPPRTMGVDIRYKF